MIAISINDLSLFYGTDVVLDGVSFSLEEGDKLGIIGVNGCGKSTLFRLITGREEPTRGEVFLSAGKTMGILTQEGAFEEGNEGQTLLERMYAAFPGLLSMEARLAALEAQLTHGDDRVIREYTDLHEKYVSGGGLEYRSRAASILQKLGFDQEVSSRPISTLSGGQRTRLALAVELLREPDILLLDEPTNHLDIETLSWLESYLASYSKCVMVISHDRYFLDRVTSKTLVIEHHGAKLYRGGYTKSAEQRAIDREIALRHWKNQQKEIARQQAYIAQQRAWNRERNIIAAESRQKLLDKMEKIERPQNAPKAIQMRFQDAGASGNDVLSVRNVTFGYGGQPLFSDLSFLIKRGERALIIGPNGCGKSTLIKLILSKLQGAEGVIEAGYHVKIGYYDQENQNLDPENTVLEELWSAYPTMTETEIRNTLGLFRFVGDDVFKTVSVLSGGERARLTLSKLILSRMNFLVLDEPTNHLDIDSREALEGALEQFDGTILAVSHDRYFIDRLATRILELKPGACFPGDLLDYRVDHAGEAFGEFQAYKAARIAERQEEKGAQGAEEVPVRAGKEAYLKNKQNAAEERKKRAQRARLEKECETLEAELAAIETELFGSAASNYLRAAELDTQKTRIEERLMEIYEALED